MTLRSFVAAAAAVFVVLAGSGGSAADREGGSTTLWTTGQAESIRFIRGLRVRVLDCRGLGTPWPDGASVRFARFACVAGARLPWERFDSVAVRFQLRPLRAYDGSPGSYVSERVSFIGGPGIP